MGGDGCTSADNWDRVARVHSVFERPRSLAVARWIALCTGALLVFGLGYSKGAFAAHLARPWLRCLGMASFSFYMLHTPMFRVLRGIYFYFGWETRTWAGFWLVSIGAYVVIQTAAFIMLYRYELPMQKWLRQLRVRPTSTAQSVEILEPTLSLDNAYESTSVGQPKGLAVTHNGSTPRQAILGWTYAISGK